MSPDSARRPAHAAPSEEMEVKMEDLLTAVLVAVDDDAVTGLGNTELGGHLADGLDQMGDGISLGGADVIQGGDMLGGNDHHMNRSRGMDVLESQTVLVSVDDFGGDLPVADFTKNAIGHGGLLANAPLAVRVPRQAGKYQATRHALLLSAIVICLAMLTGCPSVSGPSPSDLRGQVDRFHHDLRWKYNNTVVKRVNPEFAEDFLDVLEDLNKDLKITDWDVRRVKIVEEKNEKTGEKKRVARLKVHLTYYLMPSTVLHDENVKQVWEEQGGRWFLISMKGGPLTFPPPEEGDDEN